jgi:hypothetical protein
MTEVGNLSVVFLVDDKRFFVNKSALVEFQTIKDKQGSEKRL